MKQIFFSLIVLVGVLPSSGQSNLSKNQIEYALDNFISIHYSESWNINRPAFALIIDCQYNDTVYFSISNILQPWEYDRVLAKYYFENDENTLLIRLENCDKNQPDFLIPLSKETENAIKKKLMPDSALVSSLMHVHLYYSLPDELPVIIGTYIYNIDEKYMNLFPFPDAIPKE